MRTPAGRPGFLEMLLALEPAHRAAIEPPRGRPGEGPTEAAVLIDYLEAEDRHFPILKPAA